MAAYAVAGIPEIIHDGENGFLIPQCSPEALARKLNELREQDLQTIANQARADWEKFYTVERYRREMIEIFATSSTQALHMRKTT